MHIKKDKSSVLKIFVALMAALAIVGFGLFISYYFLIILKPNFEDKNFNYVKSLAPAEIKPGDMITLEMSYLNTGSREVNDVYIEFPIPENTTLESSDYPGKYFMAENKLIFDKSNLKKGEGEKIHINLLVDKPLDNGTEIATEEIDIQYKVGGELMKVKLGQPIVFKIKSSPKLVLSKISLEDEDGGDLRIGDILNVSFSANNTGDMNATDAEITAMIPEKARIIENSITPKDYEIMDGKIIWHRDEYTINDEIHYSFDIKVLENVSKDEVLTHNVYLKSAQGDNLSVSAQSIVKLFPDLGNSSISLFDKNGEYLWAGDVIGTKIVIENNGDLWAEDVMLTCPIPENTSYVNGSAVCEGAEISNSSTDEIVFKIKRLEIGQKRELSIDFRVNSSMTDGGTIKTDFKLSANGTDFNIAQDEISIKANFKVTIVCLGDSLVAFSNWPQILGNMLEATYPRSDYKIVASGIPQETASGGYYRFDSSVAVYKPHIVIIGYGTNDTGGGTEKFNYYLNNLVSKAKSINATVFLESLGYINTSMEPSKASWPEYQRIIYNVGSANGIPVVDIYTPLSKDPARYIRDWVHYTPEGSAVVAQTIFNYLVQYLDEYGVRK